MESTIQAAIQPQLPTTDTIGPPLQINIPQEIPPSSDKVPDVSRHVRKETEYSVARGGFCEIFVGSYHWQDGRPPEQVALRFPHLKGKPEQAQKVSDSIKRDLGLMSIDITAILERS